MFTSRRITSLNGSKFQDNFSTEFNLDSTNEYIQTSSTYQSVFRGSWSVVAWIKAEDAQTTANQKIFGSRNSSQEDWFYVGIEQNDGGNPGKLRTYYETNNIADSGLSSDMSSSYLADGQGEWIHCIWSLDVSDNLFRFHVNGIPQGTSNYNTADIDETAFTTDINPDIGRENNNGSGSDRFDGKISEFTLYDVAMKDNDAMTLYNGREAFDHKNWSKAQNVALWFRMGDGGAIGGDENTIKDLSGNGNNGTQQNIDAGDIAGDTP